MKKSSTLLLLLVIISAPLSSQVFYLNSNLPPILQANAGNDNFIDPGDSVQIGGLPAALNGYGNYTYFWEPFIGLSDPSAENPWASPNETTTYILTVSDGHHCLAMDEITIKVGASGINNLKKQLKIFVYPNPAVDFINIQITGHEAGVNLRIINSLGQTVIRKEDNNPDDILFSFDTHKWNKGIFFLLIQTGNRVESKVFVIR